MNRPKNLKQKYEKKQKKKIHSAIISITMGSANPKNMRETKMKAKMLLFQGYFWYHRLEKDKNLKVYMLLIL